jgi:3-keto-5-aminohexanoate cleavage enzyme
MAGNLSEIPFGEPSVRPAPQAGGPRHHHWGVIGIGRDQWMLVAAALTLGGSIRVGLEDNFYLPTGEMARSNGDLVAKARQLCEDCGRRPATIDEARALLGLVPRPVGERVP